MTNEHPTQQHTDGQNTHRDPWMAHHLVHRQALLRIHMQQAADKVFH